MDHPKKDNSDTEILKRTILGMESGKSPFFKRKHLKHDTSDKGKSEKGESKKEQS